MQHNTQAALKAFAKINLENKEIVEIVERLPYEIDGLTGEVLHDLSWVDERLGFKGFGFFPVVNHFETLDDAEAEKYEIKAQPPVFDFDKKTVFINHQKQPKPKKTKITQAEFMIGLGMDALLKVTAAAKDDPQLNMMLEVLKVAGFVDLKDEGTRNIFKKFVSDGHTTADKLRAAFDFDAEED